MKFRIPLRSRTPAFQMTSLMDVIFLLLCFFVGASLFSKWESEISIQLPTASSATPSSRYVRGECIFNLTKEGEIKLNGGVLTLEKVKSILSGFVHDGSVPLVILRADKEVVYEKLMELMDACRSVGVADFSLATQGEDKNR